MTSSNSVIVVNGSNDLSSNSASSSIHDTVSVANSNATDPCTTTDLGQNNRSGNDDEYYVMVHVDVGETFSVRVGDQIQRIPGPATVRMVSNNGPPLPMPMEVPAGHLVQQIVDEKGILMHVILSPYPTATNNNTNNGPSQPCPPPQANNGECPHSVQPPLLIPHASPHHQAGLFDPGTASGPYFYPSSSSYLPYPPPMSHHHHHHPGPLTPHFHSNGHHQQPTDYSSYASGTGGGGNMIVLTAASTGVTDTGPVRLLSEQPITADDVDEDSVFVDQSSPVVMTTCSQPSNGTAEAECTANDQLTYSCHDATNCITSQQHSSNVGIGVGRSSTAVCCKHQTKLAAENYSVVGPPPRLGTHKRATATKPRFHASNQDSQPSIWTSPTTHQQRSLVVEGSSGSAFIQPTDLRSPSSTLDVSFHQQAPSSDMSSASGHQTKSVNHHNRQPPLNSVLARPSVKSQQQQLQIDTVSRSSTADFSSSANVVNCSSTNEGRSMDGSRSSDKHATNQSSRAAAAATVNQYQQDTPFKNASRPRHLLPPSRRGSHFTQHNQSRSATTTTTHWNNSSSTANNDPGESTRQLTSLIIDKLNESERQTLASHLSNIEAPQVSSIEPFNVEILLGLPPSPTTSSSSSALATLLAKLDSKVKTVDDADPVDNDKVITKTGRHSSNPKADTATKASSRLNDFIQFELFLAERDAETYFNCVYIGDLNYISLQDLRPGTVYYVKTRCSLGSIRGQASTTTRFVTSTTEPTTPRSVALGGITRTSLHLKWLPPNDNHGSRVTAYVVEMAPAAHVDDTSVAAKIDLPPTSKTSPPAFVEVFRGLSKSFKLTQLTPSTSYIMRVAAVNAAGQGPWSEPITGTTSGNPPPTPFQPRLLHEASVHSLTLTWDSPDTDDIGSVAKPIATTTGRRSTPCCSYLLEMDDETMVGHSFVRVFDGPSPQKRCCVDNLRRVTSYRFRLAAYNQDGKSRWTEPVTFSTLPDKPSQPLELRLSTTPPQPTNISLTWNPPEDNGGLPIKSYVLEGLLPQLPVSLTTPDSHGLLPDSLSSSTFPTDDNQPSDRSNSSTCWPRVVALSGTCEFASTPPPPPSNTDGSPSTEGVAPRPVGVIDDNDDEYSSHRLQEDDSLEQKQQLVDLVTLATRAGDDQCTSSSPLFRLLIRPTSANAVSPSSLSWFQLYRGSGRRVKMSGLLPGTSLVLRVRAVTCSPCEDLYLTGHSSALLTIDLPPVAPSLIITPPKLLGYPTSSSLRLGWLPPTDCGGAPLLSYDVQQMPNDEPIVSNDEGDNGDDETNCHGNLISIADDNGDLHCLQCQCRVDGLKPGRLYAFRVRARNRVGVGPWSDESPGLATKADVPVAPQAPRVEVGRQPASPLRLYWSALTKGVNGAPVDEYRLEWRHRPDNDGKQLVVDDDSDQINFQLLYQGPATSYQMTHPPPLGSRLEFRLLAINTMGPSPWSSPLTLHVTPPGPPPSPIGLRLDPIGGGGDCLGNNDAQQQPSARLRWLQRPPAGTVVKSMQVSSYSLEFYYQMTATEHASSSPTSSPSHSTSTNNVHRRLLEYVELEAVGGDNDDGGDEMSHLFTNLKASSTYSARLRALNAFGYGQWTDFLTFTTSPPLPNAPSFIAPDQLSQNHVRLAWTCGPELDRPLVYTLELASSLPPSESDWLVCYQGIEPWHKVTRLTEHTSYQFRVKASNSAGRSGHYSESLTITTHRSSPPQVRGLKVAEIDSTRCLIEWSPVGGVHHQQDPIIYLVQISPVDQQHESPAKAPNFNQVYRGSSTACNVEGLQADTEYVVRIQAVRVGMTTTLELSTSQLDSTAEWHTESPLDPSLIVQLPGPHSSTVLFTTTSVSKKATPAMLSSNITASTIPSVTYPAPAPSSDSSLPRSFTSILGWIPNWINNRLSAAPTSPLASPSKKSSPFRNRRNQVLAVKQKSNNLFKRLTSARLSDRKLACLCLLLIGLLTLVVAIVVQRLLLQSPLLGGDEGEAPVPNAAGSSWIGSGGVDMSLNYEDPSPHRRRLGEDGGE